MIPVVARAAAGTPTLLRIRGRTRKINAGQSPGEGLNQVISARQVPRFSYEESWTIGKTVQIRRGAAAVIGQASELPLPLWPGKRRPWEGRSESATSPNPKNPPPQRLF